MATRVLLAEGDYNFQRTVARILSDEQIEAVCAGDGRDALCILNEIGPDLLIAECALQGKNGYELCQYVREEPDFQSLPVILLDNYFDAFNQNRAYGVGADAYLSKPFEPSELLRILHNLLGSKEETYGEVLPAPDLPERSQQLSPAIIHSSTESSGAHSSEQILTDYRGYDAQVKGAGSPEGVLAKGRNGRRLAWWGLLMGAIIAAVALALLVRTPDIGDPTIQSGEAGKADGLQTPEQQSDKPLWEQGTGNINLEAVSPSGGNGVLNDASTSTDEDAKVAQTSLPESSTGPADEHNNKMAQSESGQGSPPDAARKDVPDSGLDQAGTRLTRPHSVSSTRSNTISSRFRQSGWDMKQAGKHLGSGAKHFGQGSGKASVYTGKKIGKGVKRIGSAIKKIF